MEDCRVNEPVQNPNTEDMKLTRYIPSNCGPAAVTGGTEFSPWLRNPFRDYPAMAGLFDFGSFFGTASGLKLATDVFEDADNFYARFEVPGVKREDINIELVNGLLTVSVEKRENAASGEQNQRATRSLNVPEKSVSAENVGAKLEDGVLTVTLPKRENSKPRTVPIA